ncbi:DnaJ domain-containing protein [Vreelandella sp. EE22]
MPIARFSTFERVLIKSRSQVDTAVLLLLAWVLTQRRNVSEGQRRRRLAQVSARFQHGHELGPLFTIARQKDLKAIQLAAELVRKECSEQRRLAVMHQAIALATDDGALTPANHYVIRFLADVLTIAPGTLATLFVELTGAALGVPEDLSRESYWLRHDAAYREEKARQAQAAHQRAEREKAEQARAQYERAQHEKAQEEARQAQARREKTQKERARRDRAHRDNTHRDNTHRENAHRENAYRDNSHRDSHRGERARQERVEPSSASQTRRALAVLGLSPGASRVEIRRAYRRMAQLHHPDRFYTKSEHHIALASQRFQRIKSAYDHLIKTTL